VIANFEKNSSIEYPKTSIHTIDEKSSISLLLEEGITPKEKGTAIPMNFEDYKEV